jgi:hypothetical protein
MADDHENTPENAPILFGWSRREWLAIALVLGVVVVWGGGYALFGFPGLIVPALLLVAVAFVMLVWISFG